MRNLDFVSEKWRTCRRTRQLAHIHFTLSTLPIIYVAVYAEAQRRADDNKEFAAALEALMFNIFQLGWVQLNEFVAWCKDAVECIRPLQGTDYLGSEKTEECDTGETSRMKILQQWLKKCVSWCKRPSRRAGRREVDGNDIEDAVMVNKMVVDNELGGREVTVSPSWEKIWRGLRTGELRLVGGCRLTE